MKNAIRIVRYFEPPHDFEDGLAILNRIRALEAIDLKVSLEVTIETNWREEDYVSWPSYALVVEATKETIEAIGPVLGDEPYQLTTEEVVYYYLHGRLAHCRPRQQPSERAAAAWERYEAEGPFTPDSESDPNVPRPVPALQ